MGVLIKQSKYCYIWTNETIEDPDRVFETAKTMDPSNYIAYEYGSGLSTQEFTYPNGNSNGTTTATYTFGIAE